MPLDKLTETIIAVKAPALPFAFADDLELLLFEIDLLKIKRQNF